MVGLGSFALLAVTAGQSIGGPLRRTALLAPHGRSPGTGPGGFAVNKPAAEARVRSRDIGPDWRLTVTGAGRSVHLDLADLRRMTQHGAALPIACVEGWSTGDQHWEGVRLRDLAALVGHRDDPPGVFVQSVQRTGSFRAVALSAGQVRDGRSLLALRVNGAELTPDHGYPARVIVPAAPGVMNTKWVGRLTFGATDFPEPA
jgi:DMSO/TMAO reductase YedYZ molybdopterin-dependent catalytic subunit